MENNKIIKGSLSAIILKLLEDNGRMYGYEMTKATREMSMGKIKITEAALYPALHKMVLAGILKTETENVDGRLRKYYLLTQKGKKETTKEISAMQDAIESLKLFLNPKLVNG